MPAADLPLPPARMLISADEFVYRGSRRAGPSGKWNLQLRNNGEDDHDLLLRRNADGVVIADSGIVHPDTTGTVKIRLKPGRYTLFCSIADHESLGMRWGLIVRVPKHRTTAP